MRIGFSMLLAFVLLANPARAESTPPEQHGEGSDKADPETVAEEDHAKKEGETQPSEEVKSEDPFCDAIVDPAREQRYLLKQKELEALLASVNARIAELEKRKAEHEQWIKRREDFASRATKNLVEIYASMKPEAAASRLTELNQQLAASLLLAITPRQASAILNEMDEKTAAELTGIMSASARRKDPS